MKKILAMLCLASIVFAGDISSPNGRYELKQISDMRRDQFLVDTQLGRVWGILFVPYDKNKDPEEGFITFAPITFEDGNLMPDSAGVKNANGRYKLDQISSFRRDQFLLDTFTGRAWTTALTKDEILVFQPVLFIDGGFLPDGGKKKNNK